MSAALRERRLDTPVGPVLLRAGGAGLCEVRLAGGAAAPVPRRSRTAPAGRVASGVAHDPGAVLDAAAVQVSEYLAGRRREFTVPLDRSGQTPFRRRVLEALVAIPYGTVVTYGALAERIGRPGAARAVGGACGANPLPLVIPCHRVVAADGLGGYGPGLALKRRLLALESQATGGERAGRAEPALAGPPRDG